ncbi:MAG: family 43 glycosylhydrolase [Jatrophihabitans sp.]|uniref:family 43 glycosylhydrolase n=1 Tax=Jatrophihabitans sp. TaxID=1932789 RepID=UPI003F81CD40
MLVRRIQTLSYICSVSILLLLIAGAPPRLTGSHAASLPIRTAAVTSAGVQSIVPAAAWSDQHGDLAQLRAVGTVLDVSGTYYAWGENMVNGLVFTAITCYSSTDLVNWHREPDALSLQSSGDLGPNRAVGRPSVLYNATTHKFVMWLHIDTPHLYDQALVGVAESTTPCGPYTYLGSSSPLGQQSRDINVYQDTDGTGYLLTEDRANGLRIDRLSSDFESVTAAVAVLSDHEAPAMTKVGSTYYLFGSHLTSLATNDNQYTTATSLAGPWTPWKNFAPTGTNTFDSQISSILDVTGAAGTTHVFIGDRWNDNDLYDSAPIWLPITIGGDTASLQWVPSWTLDLVQGTWAAQTRNDSYEAGGPGTTLSGSASVTACTGCTGESVVSNLAPGPVTYTYDDAGPALTYTGAWTHGNGTSFSTEYDSTKSFAQAAGASTSVTFTGTTVRLIGLRGPNYGKATMTVDGTVIDTVDAYATTQQHLQTLFTDTGLSSGTHTFTITLTGTKNAASSGTYFSVDAIDLNATDQRNPQGGTLTFAGVQAATSGVYTVKIGYSNPATTDQQATISVNGGSATEIAFPPTTDGNTTAVAVANLTLQAGANTIAISPSASSAPEIDTLTVPVGT